MKRIGRYLTLITDPVGRRELTFHSLNRLWYILQWIASIYRHLFIQRVKVVVVIGSLGKTTTTNAIRHVLDLPANSNFTSNAWSALAVKLLKIKRKQPFEVIEVGIGSRRQMKKFARMIRPDIVVVTSIASEHTGLIGSIDNIIFEKSEMLRVLSSDGLVVYNSDDQGVVKMQQGINSRKTTYGYGPESAIRCIKNELVWPLGMNILVNAGGKDTGLQTGLFSGHMVYPVLAALAVGKELGLAREEMISRLAGFRSPSGRMNVIKMQNGAFLIRDDYKSTYETIFPALEFFREVPAIRKILVMGDSIEMPHPWQESCRKIGKYAAGFCDRLMFIGRMEAEYAEGALKAGMLPGKIIMSGNRWQEAFHRLPADLGEGDVILVKALAFQRLQRFSLALLGEEILCDRTWCQVKSVRCEDCAWKYWPGNQEYTKKTFEWDPKIY